MAAKYKAAIGIECHVQLKTATKLFAAVGNDARKAKPNTLISHICLGMPGALPVLNEKAVDYAVRMAYAFNTEPEPVSYFERKHYFYPDLPKGYQITQLHNPIIKGGYVEINEGSASKKIRLNRVQIEEDAGKNTHPAGKDYSLVDLNRAGTPLLEIVSEPDIMSPAQARAFARELYLLARYAGVSDADMYHGNMRFDVNVSLSENPAKLGTRTETKNLNSFRSVERAVEYEIKRQSELLDKGHEIVQETRGWDDAKQKTFSQRGKEEAHDYRYMPDPDLPPIEIDPKTSKRIAKELPRLPNSWRDRLRTLKLEADQIELMLEAEVEDEKISYLHLIEANLDNLEFAKKLADWFINIEIPLRREQKVHTEFDDNQRLDLLKQTYEMAVDGKLSSTNAKSLITTVLTSGAAPRDIEKYAEEQGLIQLSDETSIENAVKNVLADNQQAVNDVKNGESRAIGFLVGQTMKATEGKANPELAQKIIKKLLGND